MHGLLGDAVVVVRVLLDGLGVVAARVRRAIGGLALAEYHLGECAPGDGLLVQPLIERVLGEREEA